MNPEPESEIEDDVYEGPLCGEYGAACCGPPRDEDLPDFRG